MLDNPEFLSLIEGVYQKGGYSLLGMADQGFRVMSTNIPVTSLADFKGQKIRTMENPYHLLFWQSAGASPTPMSFSEVYIGLQQHTLDAQENPYEVIVSNRLFEQQDYVVETNHLPHLITLIAADRFMEQCTPKEQAILEEAVANAVQYAREQSDLRIDQRKQVIEESGTKIVQLDEPTLSALQQAAEPVREAIEQSVDPALMEAWLSAAS